MTRQSNARLAGASYLLYIAAAFPAMVLMGKATTGTDMTAKLAALVQHAREVHIAAVLALVGAFCALALAVSLYAITRDEDPDLAMLGLTCRVAEGVIGGASIPATLALLDVAMSGSSAAGAFGTFVLFNGVPVTATFFAVGSTLFSWLLLRGRMIPVSLGWLGVLGSALLVVVLPLQLAGYLTAPLWQLTWLPVAVFELTLAPWLLIKGVAERV
jgi:hypothetical protein